jgi:tryptophan synthase alpha chain
MIEDEVAARVAAIKAIDPIPVEVGFGIRDAESARRISTLADGVIVGSVLVNAIAEHQHDLEQAKRALGSILGTMRAEMDRS